MASGLFWHLGQLRFDQALQTEHPDVWVPHHRHTGKACFVLICDSFCLSFLPPTPSPVKGSVLSLGFLIKANHSPHVAG